MVKEILEYAIRTGVCIIIGYSEDGEKLCYFHIENILPHPHLDENYIIANCIESESALTFFVGKIVSAELDWVDFPIKNSSFGKQGIYLLANGARSCRQFLLQKDLNEWEKHYQNPYIEKRMYAFHYVPYFEENISIKWTPFVNDEKELHSGIYIFAYNSSVNEEVEYDMNARCDIHWWSSVEHNGVKYALVFIANGISSNRLVIPKGMNLLAYNYATSYNDVIRESQWNSAVELGLVKES